MSAKSYRTEIPNIIDDLGLDPYERALYVHYKRVCGSDNQSACTEGVRTTAQKTKISIGKVAPTRKRLIERGLIEGDIQQGKDTCITVVNIWDLNTTYYQQKERPNINDWTIEQLTKWASNCSPDEQLGGKSSQPEQITPDDSSSYEQLPVNSSQPEQHCSPDEQKKEPTKKTTKKPLSKDKGKAANKKPNVIPSFKVYVDVTGYYGLNKQQRNIIHKTVGTDPANLEKWQAVIEAWILCGNKPINAKGMIDWFNHGIPDYAKPRKNGATNATYQNGAKQNKRKPGAKPDIDHEQFKEQLQNL